MGKGRREENSHPVKTITGPLKALLIGKLPNVNNSPRVTGCLVISPRVPSMGSKWPGRRKRNCAASALEFVR